MYQFRIIILLPFSITILYNGVSVIFPHQILIPTICTFLHLKPGTILQPNNMPIHLSLYPKKSLTTPLPLRMCLFVENVTGTAIFPLS